MKKKSILNLTYGTRLRIGNPLGGGGEGITYRSMDIKKNIPGVYKVFKDGSPAKAARVKFLVDQHLNEQSELFCAPTDYYANGHVGHFAPFAPGDSLEKYLETPGGDYAQTYTLTIALCQGFAILNRQGIAQGDPSTTNGNVQISATGPMIHLFDFDNYNASGVPPPTAFGQEDRMAPELRQAWQTGGSRCPDERSDMFALTTIVHEMLLLKSWNSGFSQTEADQLQATHGGWPHDPALEKGPAEAGGYPSTILNAELAGLLRRGLSPVREDRPNATTMTEVLSRNLSQLWVDPHCKGPCFIDVSKTHCPICGRPFPITRLVFHGLHKMIPCDRAAICIGRVDLPSPRVSSLQAELRRFGPETRLIPRGSNGTYRWNGSGWLPLAGEVILQPGDRLRFADVECVVEEVTP